MSTARRTFLKGLAVLAAGGTTLRNRLLHAQGGARTGQPDGPWDLSWTERVTGKYRGVFDNPEVSDGVGLFRAVAWKDEVIEAHGASPDEVSTVLVIRHRAIPLIMNDEFWAHHELGAKFSVNDPATRKPAVRNPYRAPSPAGASGGGGGGGGGRSSSIAEFVGQGGIVLACNLSFARMVALARDEGGTPAEVRAHTLEHVLPGVILQPSGFFAAIEAQRAGCGFFPASG
jgi:hypothetical protein